MGAESAVSSGRRRRGMGSEIKERVKLYNIELEERAKFGQRVQSMNEAWSQFNNSMDELQRALSRIN